MINKTDDFTQDRDTRVASRSYMYVLKTFASVRIKSLKVEKVQLNIPSWFSLRETELIIKNLKNHKVRLVDFIKVSRSH